MSHENPILADIEAFLAETGMSATRFGTAALNDPRFVPQLREGRRVWPETAEKARTFMETHKSEKVN